MMAVTDNSGRYKKALDAILAADGVMVEAGILSAKDKYPPKGKAAGVSVAKVAGIHQAAGGWHTKAIDQSMSKLDFSDRRMQAQLIAGRNPMELAAEKGEIALAAMKKEVMGQGLKKTGLFLSTIKFRIKSTKAHAAQKAAYKKFLSDKAYAQKRVGGRFA